MVVRLKRSSRIPCQFPASPFSREAYFPADAVREISVTVWLYWGFRLVGNAFGVKTKIFPAFSQIAGMLSAFFGRPFPMALLLTRRVADRVLASGQTQCPSEV